MKDLIKYLFIMKMGMFFSQILDTNKVTEIDSVIISSFKVKSLRKSSLNITSLKIDSLSRFGNYNLTDLMSKTPGIAMFSTGVAIAKPVIRGLYGNRVLMLISGLKFDNQQWQEEHGLGLSDLGLSRVEIIKGPMSVLYGTEAIGGVINVIEEDKPKLNSKTSDYSVKLNSNTLGGNFQGGYKANFGKKWFRIRVGIENNADYSDGNNVRVLNSRFDGYQIKSTYGLNKKNWTSTNNYMGTFNRYGFIFKDIYDFVEPDKRWSRSLSQNPCHLVLLNIVSSENKIELKNNSLLNINLGIQSNIRMENEGGGAISLNMHLFTFQYLLKWERFLNEYNKLIISNLGSIEKNTNYGSRKIVPDAYLFETNMSAYLESTVKSKLIFENGFGIGYKFIQTLLTKTVNTSDKLIHPFEKKSPFYNVFTGFTYFPSLRFNIKANFSTGIRVPNLAELASNGLHEGIFTYEIGNPNLKNEQIIAGNVFVNFKLKYIHFTLSPFYNYFNNYVYLSPTDENWFGFPVYRYKQQNATQYGSEIILNILFSKYISSMVAYSGMLSKTNDGNYTPYIPSQKIASNFNCLIGKKTLNPVQFNINIDYYFKQNFCALYEKKTPEYWLLNTSISKNIVNEKLTYLLTLSGNNLLNVHYYDHLSRFKNYNLYNIGRNVTLSIKIKINETPLKSVIK
ncbi:MAG: TonB-dependent receptor [Flavobacteriia bacterium]|nr:TonB-dependent receptor [Flavobacteriia bacterium]